MKSKINIFEQGLEEYPKVSIIIGNLIMVLWISLGTVACWFLYPLIAWVYLALAIAMVGVILRKLVCTKCYYYGRWCSMGWGKLSALLFRHGDIEKFGTSIGIKLAPITYGLLSLIPFICIVISIVMGLAVLKIVVLLLLLLISFYSGFTSRRKACANCRMKLICPGSAVKS